MPYGIKREIPEEAVPIKDYPNYSVSRSGNVYNHLGKRLVLMPFQKTGYLGVDLCSATKKRRYSVHRLVAEAFIPNPYNFPQVNHKNGIRNDNRAENLEWCTASYNQQYRFHVLGGIGPRGEINGQAKLTKKEVDEIREALSNGVRPIDLAKKYNISAPTISDIKYRRSWNF